MDTMDGITFSTMPDTSDTPEIAPPDMAVNSVFPESVFTVPISPEFDFFVPTCNPQIFTIAKKQNAATTPNTTADSNVSVSYTHLSCRSSSS